MFLANAVAQCAEEASFPIDSAYQATCAADVQQVVGAMGSVATGGSQIAAACGVGKLWMPKRSLRQLSSEDYMEQLEMQKLAFADASKGDRRKLTAWVEEYTEDAENVA